MMMNGFHFLAPSPRWLRSALAFGAVLALGFALNRSPFAEESSHNVVHSFPGEQTLYAEDATGHILTEDERRTVRVYQKASPAVVHLTTLSTTLDEALNAQQAGGIGSGILVDSRGYLITNYHVIKGINALMVTVPGRAKPYTAELIGAEPAYDLAVLKLRPNQRDERFPVVEIGRSETLQIGQEALAIGSPLGLQGTMTKGIISSLNRPLPSFGGRVVRMIQIDADINPGNSGGALLNSSGELIGMNTAGILPGQASTGLNFAVPIDTLMRFAEDYIQHGQVERPRVGVVLGISVTPPVAQMLKLAVGYGVMIERVEAGSPAAQAGLRGGNTRVGLPNGESVLIGGDVITHVNGKPVEHVDVLLNTIEAMRPGAVVILRVSPGGTQKSVNVQLKLGVA